MNDAIRQYQREPGVAHVDGAPMGSERPPFAVPEHVPVPPYVMPIDQVNSSLSRGSATGTLAASLNGISPTMQSLIAGASKGPLDRERIIQSNPRLPAQEVASRTDKRGE